MSIINGMYLHVTDEDITWDVDGTSHPVEDGLPLTDTVRPCAVSISLSGRIADYGTMRAEQVVDRIRAWQRQGSIVKYSGRNTAASMQIRSFAATYTSGGGADFSMELTEVRIAKSAYVPQKGSEQQRDEAAKQNAEIVMGAKVVFKGGAVYASSDAKKAAATRGRSTCEVTKISTVSYSVHPYHLISTDGQKVHGWVDRADIEGIPATGTSGTTNAGMQQVVSGSEKAVYHMTKRGDTVYALVNTSYKYLGSTTKWVIDNNPSAFSRKGDARSLQIGKKLLMGYKGGKA